MLPTSEAIVNHAFRAICEVRIGPLPRCPQFAETLAGPALTLRRKETEVSTVDEPVSFDRDIKPLFRDRDRGAMKFFVDLWSYDDVARESDAILDRVRDGSMPCDGAWDEQRVALFERWIDGGKAA